MPERVLVGEAEGADRSRGVPPADDGQGADRRGVDQGLGATARVPAANAGNSKTPIGPFQKTVRASVISGCANAADGGRADVEADVGLTRDFAGGAPTRPARRRGRHLVGDGDVDREHDVDAGRGGSGRGSRGPVVELVPSRAATLADPVPLRGQEGEDTCRPRPRRRSTGGQDRLRRWSITPSLSADLGTAQHDDVRALGAGFPWSGGQRAGAPVPRRQDEPARRRAGSRVGQVERPTRGRGGRRRSAFAHVRAARRPRRAVSSRELGRANAPTLGVVLRWSPPPRTGGSPAGRTEPSPSRGGDRRRPLPGPAPCPRATVTVRPEELSTRRAATGAREYSLDPARNLSADAEVVDGRGATTTITRALGVEQFLEHGGQRRPGCARRR